MTRAEGKGELATIIEEGLYDPDQGPMDAASLEEDEPEKRAPRSRLPWIGTLENPRSAPMVVLNESGYLVPLLTAADLLRACKYFWQRSQD